MINTFETWYEATSDRGPGYAPLSAQAQAECCVVGGGLAGLTTALELARRGRSVVLLEAGRICAGASGRNGGFVSNGFALGAGDLAMKAGRDAARELYGLSRTGTEFVRSTIAAHQPGLKMGDGMQVCVRHDDRGGFAAYGESLARDFGEDVRALAPGETRTSLASSRYFNSLVFPNAFHIHPLGYGLLVARLAAAAGAVIHELSPVTSVHKDGSAYRIKAAGGSVTARDVVLCVSSESPHLSAMLGSAVLPVATYVAVTSPLEQDVIRTGRAVADTRRAGDYYRLLPDKRLLWGGRITTRRSKPAQLERMMQGDIRSVYPALGAAALDYAWHGLMGYALHKMPLIGRDGDGVWHATAFGGHGLNTTAMAGLLLAGAIAEGDDRHRLFDVFPPRRVGRLAGRIGVQASYWAMQARDRMDEWRNA